MRDVAEPIARAALQASGGIRSLEDAHALLDAGADRVVVGTAAFPDPAPWAEALGERLVVALDVRDGQVRTAGWTTGRASLVGEAVELCVAAGVERVLCTAIDRDGTLAGPDLELSSRGRPRGSQCWPRAACARRPTSARSPPQAPRRPSSAARCSPTSDAPGLSAPPHRLSCSPFRGEADNGPVTTH